MAQLFVVTIGPVQDFIASARRTRDLWFGSWLLSELSRAAALAVEKFPPGGCTLIFPNGGMSLARPKHDVVNRIVAELSDGIDGAMLGSHVEECVRTRLRDIRDTTWRRHSPWNSGEGRCRDAADAQIDDLLEIVWAVAPLTANYRQSRSLLESMLAARKATRNFAPVTWGGPHPKSSLDGSRESVIPEQRYGARGDSPGTLRTKAAYLYRAFGAGAAERLSGVDLLKRLGNRDHADGKQGDDLADFPSTSHIAALPFLATLGGYGRYHAAFKNYLKELRHLNATPERLALRYRISDIDGYDASILFAERLSDFVIAADLIAAQGALEEFYRATTPETDLRRPQPYYALLLADGDNMGSTIDAQTDPDAHRALSGALDGFASSVRGIVEENHRGALIYAGGDDVLAFLPLNSVLQCAKELHDAFDKAVGSYQHHGQPPSLSVGIAVCHHIEPLSDSLDIVRMTEKKAKQYPGKNALAITISKRSGVDCTIVGGWSTAFFDRLNTFIDWHCSDAISGGTAYELRAMQRRIPIPTPASDAWYAIQRLEALRIIARKRGEHGSAKAAHAGLQRVVEMLPETLADHSRLQWDVGMLADELIVAATFAGV